MARLRAPGGCPWDREQSFDSIRKYTLEEVYEVFDAIERRDFDHLAEELGDLLLQVLFYSEMAANEGHFTIADVLDHLNRKLIRRHPHVFGDEASRAAGNKADVDAAVGESSAAVLRNWDEIKAAEKSAPGPLSHAGEAGGAGNHSVSRLDGILRSMPALAEASKLGAKAQKSGFDWPSWRELLPKVAEETAELAAEAEAGDPKRKPRVEAELGDLLFTVVNLGRHLGIDGEMALRNCNLRFRRRFSEMEQMSQRPLEELAPPELEALWEQAKKNLAEVEERGPEHTAKTASQGAARGSEMIEIRSCRGFDEMEACVKLQIDTWGYDESDVTARKTFLLAQKIGGQVLGAFDGEIAAGQPGEQAKALVGFAMSLPGIKQTKSGPQPLPSFPHAGCPGIAPQSGAWRTTQMGTTT